MSPITLRDGTIVPEEVCTRFGITQENAHLRDFDKMFDQIEASGIKPVSRPREGSSAPHYIDITRRADGVRVITVKAVKADSFLVSIPAMERTGRGPNAPIQFILKK